MLKQVIPGSFRLIILPAAGFPPAFPDAVSDEHCQHGGHDDQERHQHPGGAGLLPFPTKQREAFYQSAKEVYREINYTGT